MLNLHYLELRKLSSWSWPGSKSDSFHWPDAPIWDTDFTRPAKFSISLGQQQVSQYSGETILHVPSHSCSFIQKQQKLSLECSTFLDSQGFTALQPIPAITLYHLTIWMSINRIYIAYRPYGHSLLSAKEQFGEFQGNSDKTQHRNWPDTPDLAKFTLLPWNSPGNSGDPSHTLSFQKINKLAAWSGPQPCQTPLYFAN